MTRQRIVSGMRPTGNIHIGHYHGALSNWVKLQEQYDCFFFCADWHALTSEYKTPKIIKESRYEMFVDWIAVGINPEKVILFNQSDIKEHSEFHLLLSMITPIPWLERVPSYKDMQQQLQEKDLSTYGFLGYPLLQTADIVMYQAHKVPVGIDQLPHIELSREIVRRFNSLYGTAFIEPECLLTSVPKLVGSDGRKMSKSFHNAIYFSDSEEEIQKKILTHKTDPQRLRRNDPGNPDVCGIYDLHKLHSDTSLQEEVNRACRKAEIGCVDCKKKLLNNLFDFTRPIQERRNKLLQNMDEVKQIVGDGNKKAQAEAKKTMTAVNAAMGLQ